MNTVHDFFSFIGAWHAWQFFFSGYVFIDWVLFGFCILAMMRGFQHGSSFFFGRLLQLLVLVFAVILLYRIPAAWAVQHLSFFGAVVWYPFFFLAVSALVIFLLNKIASSRPKKDSPTPSSFLDRLIGTTAGFFFALLLVSFISQFILLLPVKSMRSVYGRNKSRYGYVLRRFTPALINGALIPIRLLVEQKTEKT